MTNNIIKDLEADHQKILAFVNELEQRLIEYERVQARTKLAETEKLLSGVLYERGVDNQGFAIIRSKGDKALFHMDTKMLKRKLDVPDSDHWLIFFRPSA